MATLPVIPAHCAAEAERPLSRILRLSGTSLLALQALLLTASAALAAMGGDAVYRPGNLLLLTTSLALLACSVWSFRNTAAASRWLLPLCLACFVALFLTGFAHNVESVTLTSAGKTRLYSPTLSLAGLILMSMVLSRFLRWSATRAACNCGHG